MECEVVDARTLSSEHRARWCDIARQQPSFDAPAFFPEFVCTLAGYIPGCKIAIIRQGADIIGYLAFWESHGGQTADAIPMCDYEPLVVVPGFTIDVRELVRVMGYKSWRFNSLVTDQLTLTAATRIAASLSPRALLSNGYEDYRSALDASGKSTRNLQTKIRLLERDHGPVALVQDVADEDALVRLLQLKANQYASDKKFPPFVHDVLSHFLNRQTGRLSGKLSILKAGSQEVALVFCLKAERLLYYWFPTFHPSFRKYSPGLLTVWLLIRDLPSLDCDKIDFGPGGELYKEYFANAHLSGCSGQVHAKPIVAAACWAYDQLLHRVRSSNAVQTYVKPVWHKFRDIRSVG